MLSLLSPTSRWQNWGQNHEVRDRGLKRFYSVRGGKVREYAYITEAMDKIAPPRYENSRGAEMASILDPHVIEAAMPPAAVTRPHHLRHFDASNGQFMSLDPQHQIRSELPFFVQRTGIKGVGARTGVAFVRNYSSGE